MTQASVTSANGQEISPYWLDIVRDGASMVACGFPAEEKTRGGHEAAGVGSSGF